MYFSPFVISGADGSEMPIRIMPATKEDIAATKSDPVWQSDWESEYLSATGVEKFAVKIESGELIALGAYRITGRKAYVYILYVESAPKSNPTLVPHDRREYYGIGEVLIAFGIKYSIDHGCRGDVVFDAKTDELAKHYEKDFGARKVSQPIAGGPKRYMLADEDAWRLFSKYLTEEEVK